MSGPEPSQGHDVFRGQETKSGSAAAPTHDLNEEIFGREPEPPTRDQKVAMGFLLVFLWGGLVLGVVFLISILNWPFLFVTAWDRVQPIFSHAWGRIAASVFFFLFACGLYLLRTYMRSLYGMSEVVVGGAAIWVGVGHASSEALTSVIVIAGAIYIVVRGIDNMFEGMKQLKK